MWKVKVLLLSFLIVDVVFEINTSYANVFECSSILKELAPYKIKDLVVPDNIERIKLGKEYIRENDPNSTIMAYQVPYFSEELKLKNQVFIRSDGRLVDYNGRIIEDNSRKQMWYIYVISPNGEIYFAMNIPPYAKNFHHSSFLHGQDVIAAGEVVVKNGEIIIMTNKSGHYRPSIISLLKVIDLLRSHGVQIDNEAHLKSVWNDIE